MAGPRDLRWDFRCGKPRQPLHQREGAAGIGDRRSAGSSSPCLGQSRPGGTEKCGSSRRDKKGLAQRLRAGQRVQAAAALPQLPEPPQAFKPRSAADLAVPGRSPPTQTQT